MTQPVPIDSSGPDAGIDGHGDRTSSSGFAEMLASTLAIALSASAWAAFETNDDPFMLSIASGAMGRPDGDPHLVFIGYPIGLALQWLYGITSGVEWYGLSLLLLTVVACAVLGWSFARLADTHGMSSARVVGHAIAVSVAAVTTWNVQFTRVAAVGGVACALLAAVMLRRRTPDSVGVLLGLGGLWCLTVWVREQGAVLGLLLALPLLAQSVAGLRRRANGVRSTLRVGAVFLGILVMHVTTERQAYAAPEWRLARSSHQLVYPLADYHLHRKLCEPAACARRTGVWSANDLELIDMFTYEDRVVFSHTNLARANAALFPDGTGALARLRIRFGTVLGGRVIERDTVLHTPDQAMSSASLRPVLLGGDTAVPASLTPPSSAQSPAAVLARTMEALVTPGLVVFGVVAVLAVTTSGGRSRLAGLATAAWMVVVVIALFLFTKSVPPRVLDPIWLLGAIVVAATVPQAVRGTMPRAAVFVATLLVLIGFNGWGAWGHARSVARVQRELRTVPALAKQRVAVAISHAYGEMWHPFWGNADLHARAWFPISWPNLMPPAHEAARRMGVDRLLLELPCRDDIVLVASVSYAAAIQRFAHEHGTRGCRFVQVHQSRDLMAFVGSAPPGAGGAAAPVTHGSALQPKTD